jgi:hypothetical protein
MKTNLKYENGKVYDWSWALLLAAGMGFAGCQGQSESLPLFMGTLDSGSGSSASVQVTATKESGSSVVTDLEVDSKKWMLGIYPKNGMLKCGSEILTYFKSDASIVVTADISDGANTSGQFSFKFAVEKSADGSEKLHSNNKADSNDPQWGGYNLIPIDVTVDASGTVSGSVTAGSATTKLSGNFTNSSGKMGASDLSLVLLSSVFCNGAVPQGSFQNQNTTQYGQISIDNHADEDVKITFTGGGWPGGTPLTLRDGSLSSTAIPVDTYRVSAVGAITGATLADTTVQVGAGATSTVQLKVAPPSEGDARYAELKLTNTTSGDVTVYVDSAAGSTSMDGSIVEHLTPGASGTYFARAGARIINVYDSSTGTVLKQLSQVMDRGTLTTLTLP